ncbi:GGDEF domain-containing protein, partial [Pseudoduganella sp. FT26W]|nr:GGDEF domain-containing protein [Duganella aquatilis]
MDMFALDDALAEWEAALPSRRGAARLPLLLPLAWHLRQRDTGRALQLADEAEALLPAAALSPDDAGAAAVRLQLVRAEAAWLSGQLQPADALALQA